MFLIGVCTVECWEKGLVLWAGVAYCDFGFSLTSGLGLCSSVAGKLFPFIWSCMISQFLGLIIHFGKDWKESHWWNIHPCFRLPSFCMFNTTRWEVVAIFIISMNISISNYYVIQKLPRLKKNLTITFTTNSWVYAVDMPSIIQLIAQRKRYCRM